MLKGSLGQGEEEKQHVWELLGKRYSTHLKELGQGALGQSGSKMYFFSQMKSEGSVSLSKSPLHASLGNRRIYSLLSEYFIFCVLNPSIYFRPLGTMGEVTIEELVMRSHLLPRLSV